MVKKKRNSYIVTIDHDPIPGWNNEPEDFQKWLQQYLQSTLGHYNPEVELLGEVIEPEARRVIPMTQEVLWESKAFVDLFFTGIRKEREDDS
jgi:hypothetical protein